MKLPWYDLDHQLNGLLKTYELRGSGIRFVVGLSGGVDSVALLMSLKKLGVSVQAHFCHHGDFSNKEFRDQSLDFCHRLCNQLGVALSFEKSRENLESEDELRRFRRNSLLKKREELLREEGCQQVLICLGHHQDDLLETQLIRLLRGTGHQGLAAMAALSEDFFFRPFLKVRKQVLVEYLESQGQGWIEDPTNQNEDFLRNWIRQSWLPALEAKQPGASGALARSLSLIVEEWQGMIEKSPFQLAFLVESSSVPLVAYASLSAEKQQRLLAEWVFTLGIRDFSLGKIKEVQKRLDSPENEHTFKVGGLVWLVNAGQIKVGLETGFCS